MPEQNSNNTSQQVVVEKNKKKEEDKANEKARDKEVVEKADPDNEKKIAKSKAVGFLVAGIAMMPFFPPAGMALIAMALQYAEKAGIKLDVPPEFANQDPNKEGQLKDKDNSQKIEERLIPKSY